MIERITHPNYFYATKSANNNKGIQNSYNTFKTQPLKADTVTFSGTQQKVNETVLLAFEKFFTTKNQNGLRTYLGTTKNGANIVLEEKKHGKVAILTISDFNLKTDNLKQFILNKSNKGSSILSLDEKPAPTSADMIKSYIRDLNK